jgi:hypothetical protein
VEGALGVILERCRSPEGGHNGVSGKLLHRAAGRFDLLCHRVVEPVEEEARPLRVLRAAERGRADEVGEDNCGELALLAPGRLGGSRRHSGLSALGRRWAPGFHDALLSSGR